MLITIMYNPGKLTIFKKYIVYNLIGKVRNKKHSDVFYNLLVFNNNTGKWFMAIWDNTKIRGSK